jgi:DNA-binding transcriptional regulator LsrR (DeoR family)
MTAANGDAEIQRRDLLVTAAVLYYEQDESQQDIARRLQVSRPTVSRLLARARQLGIVRIDVVPPTVDPTLGQRLRERLGLRAVHIAPGQADEADPGPMLAGALDRALEQAGLVSGDVIAVSWGRAVYSLAHHVVRPCPGVVVAAGMGGSAGDRPWFQPNEIARIWADAFDGFPRYLHAPALVSPRLHDSLLQEPGVRATVDLWDTAKVALVGVGAWPKPDPSYAAAGFPIDDPALVDAAGDVAGWSFRFDGKLVPHRDRRRLLGVGPAQLERIPHVIGFAASPSKARAAIGAARAGLIKVLVADAATGRAIEHHLGAPLPADHASDRPAAR